jgi:acetyl esterase/lipase
MSRPAVFAIAALLIGTGASDAAAQSSPAAQWATHAQNHYAVQANVTYLTASGYDSKLDVYRRRDVQTPQPTLVFYHGGGWIGGTKEAAMMSLMPWFEMGWNVVNVEYRMARVAEAPAAVEDALCALRHVVQNAKTYNIDAGRIVVAGESAGGHLALAAGMIPATAGLASICAGGGFSGNEASIPRVAAVINWYGITDVNDMLAGPNARSYAVQWVGSGPDRDATARAVSPLTYVRAGLPPILSIHGDVDAIVPYSHGTRLHEALAKAGAPNELFTIAKGGHGNFTPEQRTAIYVKIREFLSKNGLAKSSQ